MPRYRHLEGDVTPEDIAYAHEQDKWACAMVRSIQRVFPEATHVMVNKDHVRFSVKADGPAGTRYEFETPKQVVQDVIKPNDLKGKVKPIHWVLSTATASWDMLRRSNEELTERRRNLTPTERTRPRRRARTSNPNVRAIGRFTEDAEILADLEEKGRQS
jgi:hypothetical protein